MLRPSQTAKCDEPINKSTRPVHKFPATRWPSIKNFPFQSGRRSTMSYEAHPQTPLVPHNFDDNHYRFRLCCCHIRVRAIALHMIMLIRACIDGFMFTKTAHGRTISTPRLERMLHNKPPNIPGAILHRFVLRWSFHNSFQTSFESSFKDIALP